MSNAASGLFTWRPAIAQSGTTNLVKLAVADNGVPSQSATESFSVNVLRPANPTLHVLSRGNGGFQLLVSGDVGPDYALLASTNLVDWEPLLLTNSPAMPLLLSDPTRGGNDRRFYRVRMGP